MTLMDGKKMENAGAVLINLSMITMSVPNGVMESRRKQVMKLPRKDVICLVIKTLAVILPIMDSDIGQSFEVVDVFKGGCVNASCSVTPTNILNPGWKARAYVHQVPSKHESHLQCQ